MLYKWCPDVDDAKIDNILHRDWSELNGYLKKILLP